MTLEGAGVPRKRIIQIVPLSSQPVDPDHPYDSDYKYLPTVPNGMRAYSKKLSAGAAYNLGKEEGTVNYQIFVDYRDGQTLPVTEKSRIWHPEYSTKNEDGTKNYEERTLDVQSVVPYPDDGVAEIQAGGSI
jgi:hypothetical protein